MEKKYAISLLILFWSSMFWGKAQTAIKMEEYGGVYKIPCKVNGLSLKFIFDPGASDISLSLTEALFMLKNEYLSKEDIMGKEYYGIANGDIQEGTKVNIKCIEVGGLKIYNVQASITHTDNAPLLFGQSALKRFGKFSVDYSTNTLLLGGTKDNGTVIIPTQRTVKEATVAPVPQKIYQASQKVCKDVDGNTYKSIKIGTQIWMAENLKTSHYRDGSAITEIEDSAKWVNIFNTNDTTPAWCYYEGKASNNLIYGKLYNWYTVVDRRHLCPTGWHVPSDDEFTLLTDYLGGDEVAGGKMKDLTLWKAPNADADNCSGFTALPAGARNWTFSDHGLYGFFWSSTEFNSAKAWSRGLAYEVSSVGRGTHYEELGLSVRCIGD